MTRDTVIDRFERHAQTLKTAPALVAQGAQGQWESTSWSAYWQTTRRFAGALLSMGYEPGDTVAIMGNNRPEWVIADVGAMMARAVPFGIYQTSTPDQVEYLLEHSEAKVCVVENAAMWGQFASILENLNHVQRFVLIEDAAALQDERVISFDDFLALGKDQEAQVTARQAQIQEDDLATLIYTSGTTGTPKGVMLSHHNLAFTAREAISALGGWTSQDCNVSYLPLSHIAEQMFTIHAPLTAGSPVWFCPEVPKLKEALAAARPTIFMGVPRVWEKIKTGLEAQFGQLTGPKAGIVNWSREVGLDSGHSLLKSGSVSGLMGPKRAIADKLFFSKLRDKMGFSRLRVALTGAAPIGPDVLEFFLSCGIPIHDIYGQSEGSGPTTFNRPKPGWTKFGTAGRVIPNVEVKIAPDGEILLKGGNVFMGYYKDPEATAESLVDGWLHSGDIGEFDEDQFLRITDRKKDLIVTGGGKNVAPQKIEKRLRQIEGIGQAVVIGDNRKTLVALLTLDPEGAPALAAKQGWPEDLETLAKHPAFLNHVHQGLAAANAPLAQYETIKSIGLLPHDFTIEGGELTPTQKIKRRAVTQKYAVEIEGLYDSLEASRA